MDSHAVSFGRSDGVDLYGAGGTIPARLQAFTFLAAAEFSRLRIENSLCPRCRFPLIHYRPFLNWDPPALAEIWRQQPTLGGRMQPMTAALLEELVFSKQFFEREGLIVALDGARPVGFVQAGFGSKEDGSGIDPTIGVIAMLMTIPHDRRGEICVELLNAAEDYLRRQGATRLRAGCAPPHDPFYLGLYGGSRGLGVLEKDQRWSEVLRLEKFSPVESWSCWRRSIVDFEPAVSRERMQLARKCVVVSSVDMPTESWWEACTWGGIVRTRYDLLSDYGKGKSIAAAWLWDVQPLARSEGTHAAGLIRLSSPRSSKAETKLLVEEVMLLLKKEQVLVVEAAVAEKDTALQELLADLGFAVSLTGVVWEKT